MFSPKLLESVRNYNRATFLADLSAGITVGIVALPLAIGFGIASGVTPSQGLWTAIIAGFLISALGGSLVQIGGPTGAFVPILAGIVAGYGYGGLAVATVMAGIVLVIMGAMKLGNLIKFIPYPVTSGFTSGIAVIIFVGQLKEFLGLPMGALPPHTPHQIAAVLSRLFQTNLTAFGLGLLTLAILACWPKRWRNVPASFCAIIVMTMLVVVFHLEVPTIGSKFGGIPRGLPALELPRLSFAQVQNLILPALTIAMLGAIESLLSALVADGMVESRHDSNQELMGQGIANIVCPFFGGISATGAIARTATNVRAGARTPIAGIIHAVTLLGILLAAAPWAQFIPLTSLSAVLILVAFRMGEWENFLELAHSTKSDFGVMLATFSLTVVFDLTIAVGIGLGLAAVLFVRRMEETSHIRLVTADNEMDVGTGLLRNQEVPEGVLVYRIEGPFFFAAAEKLEAAVARHSTLPRVVIFRMRTVPAIDATGLRALQLIYEKFRRKGTHLLFSGIQPQPMKLLYKAGFVDQLGLENLCANLDMALDRARHILKSLGP